MTIDVETALKPNTQWLSDYTTWVWRSYGCYHNFPELARKSDALLGITVCRNAKWQNDAIATFL